MRGSLRPALDSVHPQCKGVAHLTVSIEDFGKGSMHAIRFVVAAAALVGAGAATAQPQDPDLGRDLAATCAACHGTDGVSQGGFASLAGANKDDMVRKLEGFKAGTLEGTVMPQLMKGYDDTQIELVGAWFAAQKGSK